MGEIGKVKEGVRILKCTCVHEFQDQQYGKQMRVHNITSNGEAACTVCTVNYRMNRMNPAADIPPSPQFGNTFIPAKRIRVTKKVA